MRISAAILLLFCGLTLAAAPATQPAPLVLKDIAGVDRRPLDVSSKAAVIVFIATECPISNGYAPQINRLCKDYESKGVVFYLVHADPDLTDADAKKHASDYGFTCPVLIDRKHELVKHLHPRVTPEVFVLDAAGQVAYRGRIDNLYEAIGKRRYEATTHELKDAIEAVVSGKPVATPRTEAVGCSITN